MIEHKDVALFKTPMWASNWKVMGQEDVASGKRRDLGEMLKGTGMRKVARIDTEHIGFQLRVHLHDYARSPFLTVGSDRLIVVLSPHSIILKYAAWYVFILM